MYLEGPDPSMWDYEITGFNHDRSIMYVKFTFRIPGERDYHDINKVSLVYYGTTKDGAAQPDPAKLIYNNCAIRSLRRLKRSLTTLLLPPAPRPTMTLTISSRSSSTKQMLFTSRTHCPGCFSEEDVYGCLSRIGCQL